MQPYRLFSVYIIEDVKNAVIFTVNNEGAPEEREVKELPDEDIIELYERRSESALSRTAEKYGAYIRKIAYNILKNVSDCEECENDVYNTAWNSIPPEHPRSLKAFLGRIARNSALDRYSYNNADKRGGVSEVLGELDECVPSIFSVEAAVEAKELSEHINDFLTRLEKAKRIVFVRRYWYSDGIKDIADRFGYSESKVKSMLMRTRKELKKYLERQGIAV